MSPPAVRVVLASNRSPMTLDGTRTYLVGTDRPVVIDPGPDLPAHVDAIVRALAGRPPGAIIVTHSHADHAGAAARLAARTETHVRMAGHPNRASVVPAELVEAVRGSETVSTPAGRFEIIPTPGHAPDHLAVLWSGDAAPAGGVLFVGDLLMGEGDTALVAPPEGDLGEYLRSLDRVEALGAGILYPAHGPPLEDPAEAIRRYRRHREMRLGQVRQALLESPGAEAGALVDAVYGASLNPALRWAAEGSIRAMMEYLEQSGG
ncbi:MAG TPA: MBL fold metallo-hydrolase [Longimicrobiaceae bacterium]|nr:MBL fold metallo-hydrolase [Longimicrobiaceae bacterium]